MKNLSRRDFGKLTLGTVGSAAIFSRPSAFAAWPTIQSPGLDFTLNATPAFAQSLNGKWEVAIDPENRGKTERWFEREPIQGAQAADVPNPVQLIFPGYYGVVWYWRTFDATKLAGYDDLRIHFGGADYFAEAWLNGRYLGGNESALLPFAFPIAKALASGENKLVVRVIDACYAREIDGFQLGHVPGGRQADDPLEPGFRHFNYGGLLLPISLQGFRRPWIADGFVRADIHQEKIDIDCIVVGNGHTQEWLAEVSPAYPQSGGAVAKKTVQIVPDSEGRASVSIEFPNPRLWQIWDSFLYQVTLSPKGYPGSGTRWQARFGMREVSIVNGRMAVNGEPILQRSFLYNQIWPVTLGVPYGDMARKDIELVRRANANMLRCFSKTPLPATAEAADEAGILLQHESLGSWFLERGQREHARLRNITERGVLLLRNHPSIFWWNVLNENSPFEDGQDEWLLGPYSLSEILPSLHRLDPSRPAICDDPIWDKNVPCVWEPGKSDPTLPLVQDHYYPFTSLVNHEDSWLQYRGRAWGHEPNPAARFLAITEWGQNSSPEWERLMQSYRSSGLREDAGDYVVYRKLRDMNESWYKQSGIAERGFPTLESVAQANWESVAERYRECFALFWGNTHSVGHGLTSLDDSSYEMSGILDTWRNPKPVVFDALTRLNEPLQVNLWLRPAAVYVSDEITFDATLVNERRRLAAGSYPLNLQLVDSRNHVVLTRQYHHAVGTDPIEFLMIDSIPLAVDPGLYELQLELQGHGKNLAATRPVHVFARQKRNLSMRSRVWVWEKGDRLQRWFQQRGVSTHAGETAPMEPHLVDVEPGDLLIVDEIPNPEEIVPRIGAAVLQGACAIVLRPHLVFGSGRPVGVPDSAGLSYSPLMPAVIGEWKPELREILWWGSPGAWGYSRTALALQHPFLEGLPQAVALEAQPAYQRVAPKYTWALVGVPELARLDSAVVESSLHVDAPYTADLFSVTSGAGKFVLNTLHLAENLDADPASDRILENIVWNLGQK